MYESIGYAFSGEDVTLTPEGMVELVVSPLAINDEIARRDSAIAEAAAQMVVLENKIAELTPFKEEADRIRAEKEAQELAESQNEIKAYLTRSGFVKEEELASEEIAPIVEAVDYAAAKSIIADRYIASLDTKPSVPVIKQVDLNAGEHISGKAFVRAYLGKN